MWWPSTRLPAKPLRRARAGGGPTLIECRTYRTRAHAEGMRDAGYRSQEEVDRWKAQDPIATPPRLPDRDRRGQRGGTE